MPSDKNSLPDFLHEDRPNSGHGILSEDALTLNKISFNLTKNKEDNKLLSYVPVGKNLPSVHMVYRKTDLLILFVENKRLHT